MAEGCAESDRREHGKGCGLRATAHAFLVVWLLCGATASADAAAGETPTFQGPSALAVSKDGKTGYVANADARQVAWIDLPAGPVTRRIDVPAQPTGLVLSPDGSKLIVTCAAPRSTVLVVDAAAARLFSAPLPATSVNTCGPRRKAKWPG